MAPRLQAIRRPPVMFAHRGGKAVHRENTLDAFEASLRAGVEGLETDAWVTADGVAVLDHDGRVGRRCLFRKPIRAVDRQHLPPHIPSLGELYDACGHDFEIAIDVKDDDAAEAIVAVATDVGAEDRLWLVTPTIELLASWRARWPRVRLVHSTKLRSLKSGPERHAAKLTDVGIDAVNMHRGDWTGGLTTLAHRFGLLALGWDAHLQRHVDELLDMGIDGVFGDNVDTLLAALARYYPDGAGSEPADLGDRPHAQEGAADHE